MAIAETIVVKLTAETSQFQAGMAQASQSTKGLQTAAVSSHRALTIIKGGLLNVAATAAAVPGPIGHISAALVGLGLSTGGLLTILGVLASAALLFKKLGDDAQRAADNVVAATERMRKNLASFVQAHTQGAEGPFGLALLRTRLQEAQAQLVAMQTPQTAASAITGGPDMIDRSTTALAAQENVIRGLRQAINDLEKAVHDVRVKEYRQWAEDMKPVIANLERIGGLAGSQARILATGPGKLRGTNPHALPLAIADEDVLNLRLQLQGVKTPLEEAMDRLGKSAGKQLILGMITGIQSMQDILKSIFVQLIGVLLDDSIGSIFGNFFGGGGGGSSGKAPLSGLRKSSAPIAPASFSLNVPEGLSAPTTPFAVMRDAEWQHLLRGSLIVARTDGFRR